MIKQILVSVSNKTGLVDFLLPFKNTEVKIVSTGGSAQFLQEHGFKVTEVSEITKFPEVMGGRVKTLHPHVHMGLLARMDLEEDKRVLQESNLQIFDLVVCNLYPFVDAAQKFHKIEELIEKIDVGGPTMLRAAAKNYKHVAVVCDPADYQWLQDKHYNLNLDDRKKLAAKVFSHTAHYDSWVAKKFNADVSVELPEKISLAGEKVIDLRYGENSQQKAAWYANAHNTPGLHQAQIIQGKVLSFNNLLDLDAAFNLVSKMSLPAAVAVKHNNPCGLAQDSDLSQAVKKCIAADPKSIFGGIVAVNHPLDEPQAALLGDLFLECILAPNFSQKALTLLSNKKNLRLLAWPEMMNFKYQDHQIKTIAGGFLIQEKDSVFSEVSHWKIIGEEPNEAIKKDLIFAEKVVSSLKSNAIAIIKDGHTVGLGMGQVNRVDAVQQSIQRMRTYFPQIENTILASDAFFPFADSIEIAAGAGVRWIIQPGGSLKDAEVIEAAKKFKINMILTGVRHFLH